MLRSHPAGERLEQLLLRRRLPAPDEEDPDDREEDADPGDHHRQEDRPEHQDGIAGERRDAEGGRGEDGAAVGFVQIRPHPRDIPDVVAHIVGDGGGIAGVILGDLRLDLAHQVGADVRRLREYTAPDAREERLGARPHPEAEHRDRGLDEAEADDAVEQVEPDTDVQEPEADADQPHHGAAPEGDLEGAVEGAAGGVRGAGARVGRGLHPDEPAEAGEEPAGEEGERDPFRLDLQHEGEEGEEEPCDDETPEDDLVLLPQVGAGAGAHVRGDLLHPIGALGCADHGAVEESRDDERGDGGDRGDEPGEGERRRLRDRLRQADAARAPSPAASAHRRTMLFFTYDLLLNDHTRGEYCRSPTRLSIAF